MRLFAWLQSLISSIKPGSGADREMEEELRSHIAHRADDLERSGLSRREAERRARVEFGGYTKYTEQGHEALSSQFGETLWQDVRISCRKLRGSPGFAVAAVATLAFAIGANAVVFSILNGIVLRPLHVPDAESLYALQRGDKTYILQSYPDYLDLRDRNRTFDGLVAYTIGQDALDDGGTPTTPWLFEVSGNYFDELRIQPYLGRVFHSSDEHGPNSAPYIVLAYDYWHSHFQEDRGVVGRVVRLHKHPFTIIGVAAPEFRGTLLFFRPDFFVPIVNHEEAAGVSGMEDRGNRWVFEVNGHLKPGVTPAQATADLNSIGAALNKAYPKEDDQKTFALVRPALHGNFFAPAIDAFLGGLMLLAGLILLAACANLGSLFAARAADRGREIALRMALGAKRGRILRQLLTEAVLISLIGGALGLSGSVALLRALSMWQPFPRFPIRVPVDPDWHVYAVALLLSLLSGLLFGAVPIKQILRTDPYGVIKSGSMGVGAGGMGRRIAFRDVLLVVQIAICGLLVTSSLVAVRGLMRSMHSNFGFDPRNALLVNTDPAISGYGDKEIPALQKRMVETLESIPGVQSVGMVGKFQPLTMGGTTGMVFTDKTADLLPANAATIAYQYNVTPEYLRAASTGLLAGRSLLWQDDAKSPRVALVNREFARSIFGSVTNAIGGHFKLKDGTRIEVVGIVEDGK